MFIDPAQGKRLSFGRGDMVTQTQGTCRSSGAGLLLLPVYKPAAPNGAEINAQQRVYFCFDAIICGAPRLHQRRNRTKPALPRDSRSGQGKKWRAPSDLTAAPSAYELPGDPNKEISRSPLALYGLPVGRREWLIESRRDANQVTFGGSAPPFELLFPDFLSWTLTSIFS